MSMAAFPLQQVGSQPSKSLKTRQGGFSPFLGLSVHETPAGAISHLLEEGESAGIKEHLASSSLRNLVVILFS